MINLAISRVLMVCLGNICRSPMAEAWFRKQPAGKIPALAVSSAGIDAMVGKPADPSAVKLLLEKNIDISFHRARQLTPQMLIESDLILVMESWQRQAVYDMLASACGKVYSLGHWSGMEIMDPYQKPLCEFEKALSQIMQ